ncbi:MAG: hypothetical protein ACXWMO_08315 [Syntrophales bacterium]
MNTALTVHAVYDAFFDKLVGLLQDGESFDADLLEDSDFKTRLKEMPEILKRAPKISAQLKTKKKFLASSLFIADEADHWVMVENYSDYLALWEEAIKEGFLPDCVCRGGPTPKTKWEEFMPSPIKSLGKRSVALSAHGISVSVSGSASPPATMDIPAPTPAATLCAPPNESVTIPVNPSAQQVTDALQTFLQGNAGKTISLTSLPALSVPPNPYVALASQPIYDLNKFHQSYIDTEDKFVLNSDGSITTKKTGKKISSAKDWTTAAQNFGQAMSASPQEHQFVWSDFMLWIQMIGVLFDAYQFSAVIEYEKAWRRWRRSNRLLWSSVNPVLRDLLLSGKGLIFSSKPNPGTGKNQTPQCNDFARSGCTRLVNCRYIHRCPLCKTTYPSSVPKCFCSGGTTPSGVTPPAGVTPGH